VVIAPPEIVSEIELCKSLTFVVFLGPW
jgi:hypothetical protein